jgi:hypothetical protein
MAESPKPSGAPAAPSPGAQSSAQDQWTALRDAMGRHVAESPKPSGAPAAPSPGAQPSAQDQWMTLRDAAIALGTTLEGVRSRAKRGSLQKQLWNDGQLRVLITEGALRRPPEASRTNGVASRSPDAELAALTERLEALRSERDRLAVEHERLRADVARLEAKNDGLSRDHAAERDRLLTLLADRDRAMADILHRVIALEEARGREPLPRRIGLILLALVWWAAAGWHVHLVGKLDRLLSLDPGCNGPNSTMACGWHLTRADPMAYVAQPLIAIGLPFAALGAWVLSTRMERPFRLRQVEAKAPGEAKVQNRRITSLASSSGSLSSIRLKNVSI